MRGLKHHRSARILAAGHAFVQNLRRGPYDLATDTPGCCELRASQSRGCDSRHACCHRWCSQTPKSWPPFESTEASATTAPAGVLSVVSIHTAATQGPRMLPWIPL